MPKKILIGIGAAVFVVIWGLWYLGGENLEKQALATRASGVQPLVGFEKLNQPDSDNDGLKDWEEELWQTDPSNPDTDGDGFKDGEEVIANHSPVIKAPEDNLVDEDYKALALIRQATQTKGAPLLDPALASALPAFTYTQKDLKIVGQNERVTLIAYGKELGRILANHFVADTENEMKIVLQVFENRGQEELAKISRTKNLYLQTAAALLNLPVPTSAAPIHLNLLNALAGIAELDFQMEKVLAEPVLALESARTYPLRYAALLDAVQNINRYFLKQNIRFAEDDNIKIIPKL